MSEGDAVKVCVRVRPIIHREQGEQVNLHWKAENATISQVDGTKSFIFDRVFNSLETTSQVYQEVAVPIICSALQGYNGTIFAYGQTSSGKTYTMMGTPNSLGVIPQAVQEVFKIIQEIPSREFLLRVSYMEIYNETVTDLLCDDRKRKPLEIREDINRNVYVADLTEELVMVPEHVMQWIKKGEKNRHYGETKMNDHSSRSHTIFRMIVESRDRNDPGNSENCDGAVMVSHLNLVDLAGSERASQTGAEGVRLKEGCNINRSLFILGQVIKKLSDGQVGGFINYRDSKLTRILQNSLGGNTKTVIICTITLVSVDETLSTLQFASTAKHVRNTPHVNEVLDDQALLKRYRKEIMDLKKQLEDLEASSEIKTQAMAKEEHSQLLTEIKQLQKEREDRIWHLTSIVVASSQEDKRVKLKRRVTWAPGKSQNSLVSPFEVESKMSSIFAKQAKISSLTTLPEIDDSICAVFSDFDDAACTLDDFALDTECNFGSKVTCREKTALCRSMIDFPSDEPFHSRDLKQDSSLQKCNELEQKVAKLESQLKKLSKEYEVEVEKKESLEKETASLKQHVQTQGEKDELVKTLELEIITLKDQLQTKLERNEQGTETRDSGWGTGEEQRHLETNNHIQDIATLNDSAHSTDVDQECANPTDETLSRCVHDICQEQIQMLEQKIADLEGNHEQNDFMESLQICEALMIEKNTILEELATTRNNFDSVVVENESLKRDMAEMKKCLQEKNETNEFEVLEKATQKEYEAQLTHEIAKLKTLIENAEVYNQELETELDCKSTLLQEQEKQITELKRDTEALQKRLRYSDLSASMGESDKLYEEVVQLKQSLSDAETVTRDAQREAAFLRSANLELKEKMDELSIRSEQREKDASICEKQMEIEKLNFKRMQADLQKELRCAFNEIHQLNGLLAGKVPKDLLSRVELEKKIADYTKQLASALEEKHVLEQEVSRLSEYKSLPSEVEHLKDQVQKTSEELHLLKNEKAQSASLIDGQKHRLQEQIERIEKLTEEVTHVQAKFQEAEQQYSELKLLYEDLQERHSVTAEGLKNQESEAECLLKQMDELKRSVESMKQKLSATLQESEELVQAKQELAAHIKEMEEVHRSTLLERDNLQDQVNNLSSIVTALQQQADKQSELYNEKLALEEKFIPEMEQLREQIGDLQSSLNTMQIENAEASRKLEELHDELKLAVHHRDELHVKVEDLKAEKDSLKQDLNENIELSIETQDELRTTQEELKRQKQLVADLKKQIADSAGGDSLQAESQENILEEQISMLIKKLQENEAKYETISNEKMELERVHQSLISEMEVLQERMQSAELALAKVEVENHELKHKCSCFEEQLISVSGELDELKNISKNIQEETDCLKDEMDGSAGQMNEQVQQYSRRHLLEDGDVKHLQQQILIVLQECEHLHETLKNMMHERDQMKLDLQENIERSIETQEELRSALDELNNKTHLLDTLQVNGKDLEQKILQLEEQLNAMMAERDQVIAELRTVTEQQQNLEESNRVTKDGSPLKEGGERYLDQPEEEESSRTELKCGMEKIKKVELENQLNTIYGNLRETESKYEKAVESLELITKEKDHLISSLTVANNGLVNELALYRQGKETKDQELQASDEMHTNRDQAATASRLEETETERNLLKEKLYQLQQQLDFISHEREGHQQLIDNLKAERSQLSDLQRYTESEVIRCREEGAEIEKLKEQLRNTQQQLEYKDKEILGTMKSSEQVNGIDEGQEHGGAQAVFCNQYPGDIAFKQLEENLQKNSSLLEIMQGEKQELSNKLHLLHEELEKGILHRDDLQCKLESVLSENALLKENMETVLSCSSRTREELQRCQEELQQQTNLVNDLGLQAPGNSAKQEKETTTDFMPSLEDKVLGLQEELLQKTTEHQQLLEKKEELEEDKKSLTCEMESLVTNMVETQANLESLQNNKLETESQLLDLQQQMEIVVQERDDLNSRKVRLIAEMDQLKDTLKENNELVIHLKNELQQKTDVCQHEELEQIQLSFKNELEEHMKNLKNTEAGLETLRSEKLDTEQRLFHLQSQMELVTQEWDDLKTTQQCLITERDKLKEDLEKSVEMVLGLQGELLQKAAGQQELLQKKAALEKGQNSLQCEVESLMKNMMEAQTTLESLQNEKLETEQKLIDLQQHMEVVAQERNDLKTAHERLTEMNHLKECDEMQKTTEEEQRLLENEVLTQTQTTRELDLLMKHLKDMETDLACLQNEKIHSNEKIFNLQQHMETVTQERNELKAMLQSLLSERDQLKEDLKENVEMSIETQDDLRRAQEECQQQRQRVEKMTSVISSLEQKSFMLEGELHETTTLVKEAVGAREILEQSKQQLASEMEQLMEALKSKESALGEVEREKSEASKKILELTAELRTMAEERDQMQHSKVNLLKESTETQEELGRTQEELQQQKQRIEKLTNEIYVLEEKSSTQERELHETTTLLKEAVGAREILEQSKQQLASEMKQLMEALKSKESALGEVERENSEASKKILELTAELRTMAEERDQMQHSKVNLLKESTETQEELGRTQEELQQQKQRIEKMTNEIYVLEEKSSTQERELHETTTLLKEAVGAREILEQSKQQLASEMEQLMEALKSKESALGEVERENSEASKKILELTAELRTMADERDQMQHSKSTESEEELQQQRIEKLTDEISVLEEKSSMLERELHQTTTLLKEAVGARVILDQSKQQLASEMEQLMEALKSKESALGEVERENSEASKKIFELAAELRTLAEERDQMQHSKVNLQKESTDTQEQLRRNQDELQQQTQRIGKLTNEVSVLEEKSSTLERELQENMTLLKEAVGAREILDQSKQQLASEMEQLMEALKSKELELGQGEMEKEEASQRVLELTNGMRSISEERDQLQLSKENLQEETAQLRDAWITCQTELQAIKKERDDSNVDLLEKVNEINEMLQQISSLQQLHQEVNDEKMKNCDLCEKVDLMEKEIRVLRLMQNEPVQEEDELAERTEILERKNQELKDLMVNISTVYSNHHSLLNNLSSELHSETEMQKQSMCAIKESLSSTLSRAFGNLQTEHNKLNTQLQTLLNKFKVICRNAAVKEEHYSLVNDYDSDLCAVQKKNDALLLQCQNLEEHGTKWSESASDDLKFVELEFLNQLIFKEMQVIKRVGDGFSEVQGVLNSMEGDLKEEAKCKKQFLLWLEEFKGLHFDAKKLSEGVVQENKRVTGVLQLLTKKLKSVAQSRTKQDTMMYLSQLETDLQEKKEKNKELLQRIQHLAPSGDSSFMEEENARLREKLKNVQGELKKMQCRIQDLENELSSAKADAKQKEEKASRLEEKLLSSTAESEISEMQSKMTEKEKHLLTAQKEIQILKEKISQGAAPYKDEIDNLKSQMVKVEMDRMKLSKSADQQIASLKACIEDKEEYLRKLKENLRRSQKDTDTTFCGAKDGASLSQYPLTCGGGSGIVQSTAMLMLQSENAALKREISQYKKRCHHLSRNISIREDELKKVRDNLSETPSMLLGSLQQSEVMSQSKAEVYRQTAVSPSKSEVPPPHIASPGKTGIRRKRLLSPCKTELHKPQPMSPNKMERHSVPAMSPGKIGLLRKPDVSPFKTDGPLFSTLTESPCKKKNLLEKLDSPKEKFFDARSKSMPYCPTKFFDNSTLGDLPDRSAPSSDINPDLEAERDLYAATTTETSEVNNWWDRADKNENANECKTS